jgi:chromosome segregation ATPase
MDLNQIAKMIEWLDEERRRDKQMIATLEERLSQQQETIGTLQRRVNSVESDQTVLRGTGNGIGSNEVLEQTRSEMRQLLETTEVRRLTAEREADRRVELNREQMQRTMRELQEQVERLQRSTGLVSEVKTEGSRVADSLTVVNQRLDDLSKRLDEPERRLTFLEEQRRQDARRISEIESELPEIKKQIDTLRPKVSLIEDLSIRNERRIQELQNGERERREQIQQFLDQQSLLAQQRDQKVDDILKRFSQHDQAMQENIERFETWASAYRDMKRIIDDFDRIGERLERRINEVAEMQRLSEERFRQEWNDWNDNDQKRWKQLRLSNDEVWRNHDKEFEQTIARIERLQNTLEPLADSLKRLWNLERERAAMYRDRYQAMILQYDTNTAPSPTSTQEININNTGTSRNGSY